MIITSLTLTVSRSNSLARMQAEQDNLYNDAYFEDYTFVMPDGTLVNTKDLDEWMGQVEPLNEYLC